MIKFTGNLRCNFEKATAEIAKLKDRILGYQEQIKSLQSSVKCLKKTSESDKEHFKETLAQKDAVIKELQNRLAHASTDALVNEKTDPRFRYVTRGCAPYVEWLGQKENPQRKGWAAGEKYGEKILSILKAVTDEGKVQFMESLTLSAPYVVRMTIPDLNIRCEPGTEYVKTGKYTGVGNFTIVDEADGKGASRWGLLKAYQEKRDGWISLDHAVRI